LDAPKDNQIVEPVWSLVAGHADQVEWIVQVHSRPLEKAAEPLGPKGILVSSNMMHRIIESGGTDSSR
jgi:hypothetical protein